MGDHTNDEQYPSAPVPPHERAWRHPSEIGQAAWVRSEPPLAIGRGLLTTTGVIGSLLGLAVLWAMLPATSGGGVTALSTIATRIVDNSAVGALTRDSVADEPPATDPPATLHAPASAVTQATLNTPVPTIQVTRQTVTSAPAVAVAIGDRALVITTAAAVSGQKTVMMNLPSGEMAEARVVAVDDSKGLAVLAPLKAASISTFEMAPASLRAGDQVTALAAEPVTLTIAISETGAALVADGMVDDLPEGTPVVDADGRLVGLCSGSSRGSELVIPGDMASMKAWLDEVLGGTVWLGVHVNSAPSGVPTIAAVDPQGPAAAAGLIAGDTIRAIDNVPVESTADLTALLNLHFPGDVVTITVTRVGGAQIEAIIGLGVHQPGM